MLKKAGFSCCVLALMLIGSSLASAYPVILKINNPRNNILILSSESQKEEIHVPPRGTFEIAVFKDSDWRVKYATGLLGHVNTWNMNDALNLIIDICRRTIFKWGQTVKIFSLQVDELESGITWSSYALKTTHIFDTKINRRLFALIMNDYYDLSRSLITQKEDGMRKTRFNDQDFNKSVLQFSKNVRALKGESAILTKWHRTFGQYD